MPSQIFSEAMLRGLLGGLGQVGPNEVTVIRAQIAARDSASGGSLDGQAVHGARQAIGVAVLPLADLRIAASADASAQLRNTQCAGACEVFREVHDRHSIASATCMQVAFARVAPATVPT